MLRAYIGFQDKFTYTYDFDFQTSRFMSSPTFEELYEFWVEQVKKGVIVNFFDMVVDISAASVEESADKYNQLMEDLFLCNPDIEALHNITGLELKELQRRMK